MMELESIRAVLALIEPSLCHRVEGSKIVSSNVNTVWEMDKSQAIGYAIKLLEVAR